MLALNPMNAAIELFRYPLSGILDLKLVLVGTASTLFFAILGLYYFQKTESYFADIA